MNVVHAPAAPDLRTTQAFLAWEDQQEGRHEYVAGRIIPMTGGSRAHQRIVMNLTLALMRAIDPAAFDAVQEMRVQMPGGAVRYPDVAVAAGPIAAAAKTLSDAVVICEVLSPDTAEADRGEKFAEYQTLPGLRCYVLIDQASRAITAWRRQPDATWRADAAVADTLSLPEIGTTLTLADIYAGVKVGG
jgi:Uma2 family endonuclease